MVEDDPQRKAGLRWNGEVGAGQVLQALTMVVMATGAFVYLQAQGNQTARDVVSLREVLRENVTGLQVQITGVQSQLAQGLRDIRTDINSLPDQRARLEASERRLAEGDARDVAQDARLANVERMAIETAAQVNNLRAASAQNLPNAPGIRR